MLFKHENNPIVKESLHVLNEVAKAAVAGVDGLKLSRAVPYLRHNITYQYSIIISFRQKQITLSLEDGQFTCDDLRANRDGSSKVEMSDPEFIEKVRKLVLETFTTYYKSKVKSSERSLRLNQKYLKNLESVQ